MRRSQAPSQSATPGAKRPKLDGVAVPSNSFRALQSSPLVPKPAQSSIAGTRSSQDVLKLLENKSKKPEIPPSKPKAPQKEQLPTPESADTKYFKVFWCKASTKKHKHWEEEAILIVKTSNRSVILKSLEEKVIGQATGFRLAQLQELEDGSILKVGGREVLIQEKITQLSESNFTEKNAKEKLCEETKPVTTPRPVPNKPFTAPLLKSTSNNQLMTQKTNVIKPKHNPAGQNALVMPRPPSDVQWKECQNGVSIVDVVVDPLLTKNLRPHQRQGVTFLYECVMGFKTANMYGAILADEMGLGKTLQTITLIWTLLHQGPFNGRPTIQKILIVAPSSLVKNWYKEFRRWLGTERINVFTADQQNRPIEFLKRPLCPVMVVSYEMLVRCFDEIQQVNFDLIVCDEGHRLKNAGNKTSSLLSQMDANRKILLTGTPVQNDLKEFFTLADFVNPGILGNLTSFRRMYDEPIVALQQPDCDDDKREEGESAAAALSHLTSQFVLRRTQEVMSAHLPPKIESIVFCKPSSAQVRLYRTLLGSTTVGSFLTSGYSGNEHLGFIQALRKLCNHPSFFSDPSKLKEEDEEEDYLMDDVFQVLNSSQNEDDDVMEKSAGKFQVTFDLLDSLMRDTKEKILLVSYSTKVLDLFAEACKERKYDSLRLDGSTPTNLRMGLVDRFNDATNPQRIFLLSSKAGGVGLNLIGASRLILYDIDWNPANDLQAMARIWRDGQKRTVQIYRLLTTGTIEEKIFQRQVLKQGLSGAVVDARDSTQGHFSKEELKDLFTLREDTDCDTHDLIKCQCLDGDLVNEKPPELDDYEFELDDERDCQLGGSSLAAKSKDAAKTVDQLMDWQHFGHPFSPGIFQDTCLESALDNVSFVFRCVSGVFN